MECTGTFAQGESASCTIVCSLVTHQINMWHGWFDHHTCSVMLFFTILTEFHFSQEGGDFIPKDEKGNVLFSDVDFVDTWQVLYMHPLINHCVLEYCKIYFDTCIHVFCSKILVNILWCFCLVSGNGGLCWWRTSEIYWFIQL